MDCFCPQLRSFAAVLTRRVAFKAIPSQDPDADEVTLWEVTQEETRTAMKTHFLAGLSQEPNKSVRNKVCDTIAEMARASTASERMLHATIVSREQKGHVSSAFSPILS
jgi:hypothetical protein